MKIVFMGTPDFAVAALRALHDCGEHELAAVFTRADTPKNRGMKFLPPPVKVAALEYGLPVYQPKTLRDGTALQILREINPDVIVVAAYGRILPAEILALPRFGCINVHASLLPRYRGASPIASAILHGEKQTGVTIMQMNEGLDTGDMLLSTATDIGETETCGQLEERLAAIGGETLLKALRSLSDLKPIRQDDAQSTYAPLIKSQDAHIAFSQTGRAVACAIRAYDPAPGAFSFLGEEKLKLFGARFLEEHPDVPAGTPVRADKNGLVVRCGDGCVCISEVQKAGGKKMPAEAFFRGHAALLSQRFDH